VLIAVEAGFKCVSQFASSDHFVEWQDMIFATLEAGCIDTVSFSRTAKWQCRSRKQDIDVVECWIGALATQDLQYLRGFIFSYDGTFLRTEK
jgi:hypothetical protein